MKKFIISVCLLSFSATLFSQQIAVPVNEVNKTDYLKKGKDQQTIAWVLLSSGFAIAIINVLRERPEPVYAPTCLFCPRELLNGSKLKSFDNSQSVLLIVAGITSLTSIPLFISSGKNIKKAKAMVTFKNQHYLTGKDGSVTVMQPSIVFKIGI